MKPIEIYSTIIDTFSQEVVDQKNHKVALYPSHLIFVVDYTYKAKFDEEGEIAGQIYRSYNNLCILKNQIIYTGVLWAHMSELWCVEIVTNKPSLSIFYKNYQEAKKTKLTIQEWLLS